jgi:hypothetical protein
MREEENEQYFEELNYICQEVIIDLFVSIIENRKRRMENIKEKVYDETSCDLREVQ